MKSLYVLMLSIFCVSISFAIPAEVSDTSPCRDYVKSFDEAATFVEQVRQDLIQGTWSTQEANVADWSFQADGTVTLIRKVGKRYRVEKAVWTVQHHPTAALLYLSDRQGKELRYLVEQNCKGINLENIDSEELLELAYQKTSAQQHQSILQSLYGHWEHNLSNKVLAALPAFSSFGGNTALSAKISVDFKPDGTFAQTLFSLNHDIRETLYGKWTLSPGGKFLIISTLDDSRQIICLPIQYLEYDELVLSQLLPADYTTKADQGFYFNKS